MKTRSATSFRLTPKAKQLLRQLSEHWGITRVAVLEILIRNAAKDQLPHKK